MNKINKFVERNPVFVILFVLFLFLEIFSVNHRFFISNFHFLNKYEYSVDDGVLYGFVEENGTLISEHNDPNITIRFIDDRVRYITIQCTNPNRNSVSQVFYRRENQDWSEDNSVTFTIYEPQTTITLPRTANVTSLRFDLTDTEGDTIFCQGFTVNPDMPYNLGFFRMFLYILCLIGLIFGHKFIPPTISSKFWHLFINNGIWVLMLMLFFVNISYPVTITYDSGHYLWLADVIKQQNWAEWDLIRNPGYPMMLFATLEIFGYSQEALLAPMILSHMLFFFLSVQIVTESFKPLDAKQRFLIALGIFIFVATDPTVVGYFHTLLTENLAATVTIISVYFSLKLYKTALFSKAFWLYSLVFLFLGIVSWQLKQPYIGAAFFPFAMVCILLIFREFNLKTISYVILSTIVFFAFIFITVISWDSFIENQGNPMDTSRHFSSVLEDRIELRIVSTRQDPMGYFLLHINRYLTSANFPIFSPNNEFRANPLTYAFQNKLIAHRMFRSYGSVNIVATTNPYSLHTKDLRTVYAPPDWLNGLFVFRTYPSNFLFIITYLLLPFFSVIWFMIWIKNKSFINTTIMVLAGTSLLNAVLHLFVAPIDRYLFMGYPLNLLIIHILIIKCLQQFKFSSLKSRSAD